MTESKYSGPRITVTFDAKVLEELRVYMARKGMKAHDQSKVIVLAVAQYLASEGFPVPSPA